MKVLILFVISTLTLAASQSEAKDVKAQWAAFKNTFRTSYLTKSDETRRFNLFAENLNKIQLHNKRFEEGLETFTMGINQFTDMSHAEFLRQHACSGGLHSTIGDGHHIFNVSTDTNFAVTSLPSSVDWSAQPQIVAQVKNQGSCGSCWAFSTVGALESRYAIQHGKLILLSEQNLVDCTTSEPYNNYGCGGGWMNVSFQYVKDNKGIETANTYPYSGIDGKCSYHLENKAPISVTGYKSIKQGNEYDLKAAVAITPVAIGIDASWTSFQFYQNGVYDEPNCNPNSLVHAVLAVGYGKKTVNGKDLDFWIVKNSWGSSWGNEGYILMARNANNQCGIASAASYPTVA